jgi:F-type H+-transporting ATPase subunit delta
MPMNQSFVEQVRTAGALPPEELARVQALYENILLESQPFGAMGRIPRTYAEALLDAAVAQDQLIEVATDYRDFVYDVLPNVPGLEAFLDSPAINRRAKDALILELLDGKATQLFVDFLRVLNQKDRLGMVRFIGIAFRTLLEGRANRVRVLVETPVPLSDEQKASIIRTLSEAMDKTPVLVVRERPELIGGLIIHVGDRVFDTSVRTKLQTLRNQLLARGSDEIQSRRDRFSHS